MKVPNVTRVQRGDLPNRPVRCASWHCCYLRAGQYCDTPQINKGNGDAACHHETNRSLLARLQPLEAGEPTS